MIDRTKIHYVKSSIREFYNETPRLKINMDVVGVTTEKLNKLKWVMTQEKREVWNGLGEDANWSGYKTAVECWEDLRAEHGHKVKLWIGKLHERTVYRKGQVQNTERIEYAVTVLILHRTTQHLVQQIWWEDWQDTFEFHDIENQEYNRIWDWRNPTSSKIGTTRSKRMTL